jgi:hypothetical protein
LKSYLKKFVAALFVIIFMLFPSPLVGAQTHPTGITQIVDSSGNVGSYNSLVLDSNNNPHISYHDTTNRALKYAKWSGSSWVIQTVDSTGNVGYQSSLALDSHGNPHISYPDFASYDLKYAKWSGSSWVIQTVDSAGSVGSLSSLALDSNNNPHISYVDATNFALKYAKWSGSSWVIQTVDSTGRPGSYNSLALDSNDNPHISYCDIESYDLKYAKLVGSSWVIQTVDSTGNVGTGSSLALDSNNNPHMCYLDLTNGNLKYVKWIGSSWVIQTVESIGNSGLGSYNSFALDSNNNPHISYYDLINRDLKYAKWSGSSWVIQTVDSKGDTGLYSSIAVDSNNKPRISYYDSTNGDLKYTYDFSFDVSEQRLITFSQTGASGSNDTILSVDSFSFKSSELPVAFIWRWNSTHKITYYSPINAGEGKRYVWLNTSGLVNPNTQIFVLNISYTATISGNYQTQYRLNTTTNFGTITPNGGWYAAGSIIPISATPPSTITGERYRLVGWVGNGTGSYSGLSASDSVIMNSPITESTTWTQQFYLTVSSSYGSPNGEGWYNAGSTTSFGVSTPDTSENGVRRVFSSWNGTGTGSYSGSSASQVVTMNYPIAETAVWQTQYQVSFVANPSGAGSISPSGDMWIDEGSSPKTIVAIPNPDYHFSSWSAPAVIDIKNSSSNPNDATINGPGTITANFESNTPTSSSPSNQTATPTATLTLNPTPTTAPGMNPLTYIPALSLAFALTVAMAGLVSRKKKERKEKERAERIKTRRKELLNETEQVYIQFKMNVQRCEDELHRIKDVLIAELNRGTIDESSYNILNNRLSDYLTEMRRQVVNTKLGSYAGNLRQRLQHFVDLEDIHAEDFDILSKILEKTDELSETDKGEFKDMLENFKKKYLSP